MPKIIVTKGLVDTIKMIRLQKGVKSKDLAVHINKTPGYITRLEKFEIKTIDLEIVDSIFSFILGDSYQSTEVWEEIYATLQIKLTKEEIEYEVWFSNYDTVYRYIPVPESVIEFLNKKIVELNLSRNYLLERINANESLSPEEINDKTIQPNKWYHSSVKKETMIKIEMSEEQFSNILDKKVISSPYIFIYCIVFYLLKIEKHGTVVDIGTKNENQLHKLSVEILNGHKFYSIAERENIVNSKKSKEEIKSLLSSFDNENAELISKILSELKIASEIDIRITNQRLNDFLKNLSTDVWFTLRIVSLEYHLLESIGIDQKKEFLNDIVNLINKYTDSQKIIKNSETY